MTQIDIAALVADREAGTKGPFRLSSSGLLTNDGQQPVLAEDVRVFLVDRHDHDAVSKKNAWQSTCPVREANARRIARVPDMEAALIAQDSELKRLRAVEAAMHGIANELSWSPKTREISDRIRAALGEKP